jgi:hypothetical protein
LPAHNGDGGQHTIEVRVTVDKAEVRHRRGYRDKRSEEILDERLEGAVAFGLMDNPLDVRLAAGDLEAGSDGALVLPLHVMVPTESIVFLPGAEGERARVGLVVRGVDAKTGHSVEVKETFQPARPPDGTALCDLKVDLTLPHGVHVVAVALRDLTTGATSVVATTLAVQGVEPGQGAQPGVARREAPPGP